MIGPQTATAIKVASFTLAVVLSIVTLVMNGVTLNSAIRWGYSQGPQVTLARLDLFALVGGTLATGMIFLYALQHDQNPSQVWLAAAMALVSTGLSFASHVNYKRGKLQPAINEMAGASIIRLISLVFFISSAAPQVAGEAGVSSLKGGPP